MIFYFIKLHINTGGWGVIYFQYLGKRNFSKINKNKPRTWQPLFMLFCTSAMVQYKALKRVKNCNMSTKCQHLKHSFKKQLWHGCLFLDDSQWHSHFLTNTWTKYLIPLELQRHINVLALCFYAMCPNQWIIVSNFLNFNKHRRVLMLTM